jgi:4-hydroxy-tetrahydrodipicolinate synthase
MHSLFKGVWTAVVTPFNSDGSIDWSSYEALLKRQAEAGVTGVVACGTTAETPTLSKDEKKKLIEFTVQALKGKCGVIAGSGSNSTSDTIEFSKWASATGVDGLLVVTPYYNKPSQAGMIAHFTATADACLKPVILYNVPGRTNVSINAETVETLSRHERIVGIKDATADMDYLRDVARRVDDDFALLSGDDPTFLSFLGAGGHGAISVASNLIPSEMVRLCDDRSDELNERFSQLFKDLFIEPNPVPVKYAMSLKNWMKPNVRLPLVEMTDQSKATLDKTLSRCGL